MRTFIAIELTKEIKDALGELESQLKSSGADVKWVKPENIHITLKFLGEIEPGKAEEIKPVLVDVAASNISFKMRLSILGAFPKIDYPRVIWVGIDEGKDALVKIAKDLEDRLAKMGFSDEQRAFAAHITIGRLRSSTNRHRLVELMQKYLDPLNMECPVDKLTLYKSTLSLSGPIYEAISEVHLSKD